MQHQSPAAKQQVFVAVWAGMLIACAFYFYITEIFSIPEGKNSPALLPFVYFLLLCAAVCSLLGVYFIWGKTAQHHGGSPAEYIENALVSFIIGLAFLELIAILGLAIRFLGFSYVHKPLIIAGAFLILMSVLRIGPVFSRYNYLRRKKAPPGDGNKVARKKP